MLFSTLRIILQQIGRKASIINLLIFSGLMKSLKFALFSSGGRLFHFKGSICVKKAVRPPHFCPKVPPSYKNLEQVFVLNVVFYDSEREDKSIVPKLQCATQAEDVAYVSSG